jgi:hypothetical protein
MRGSLSGRARWPGEHLHNPDGETEPTDQDNRQRGSKEHCEKKERSAFGTLSDGFILGIRTH